METLLQQTVNGLVVGSVYALVALGYTMVYGILGLINFAHGDILMVGALVALEAIRLIQLHAPELGLVPTLLAGLSVSVLVCMLLGYTIERTAYRRLRNAPRLAPLITAIGVSFLLQTIAMIIWGRNYHTFPQLVSTTPIEPVAGVFITPVQIAILVVSAVLMVALVLLVNRTRLGRAMRATAENHKVASLMGVDTNKIIAATFIIGSALAAVAGVMFSSNYGIAHYAMGFMPGLKAFTAAVLGGIGNLNGAVLGGLIIGLVWQFSDGFLQQYIPWWGAQWTPAMIFGVLVLVMIFKPSGLLGESVPEKV